ncbi:CDP-glycerol glycerophosphotransferase family protein [Isoptericola sp. NEAU-Y5]|uniref:CDP-glycerol glycerophosphotransferase family protein n=1 Tax=Isoptericola luteus TaxID=2879484 RepID=A0ABS7ZCG5_9MICO|nr:CDP-glycerol glycerophosphotransferase family protein [Isoptericola sp. NEAU-Y5]MCA5892743.1 CDP-glycerol glycerophosphotransferase family protein [Isoptericola sp. NEAU-Y5]
MSHLTPPRRPLTERARRRAAGLVLRVGARAKRMVENSIAGRPETPDPGLAQLPSYPVVAYFGEHPAQAYQLRQWLPVLEQVAEHHALAVVTRDWSATAQLREITTLPVIYARTLDDLRHVYAHVDVKTVIYVNNGMHNFQSLIYQRALHVHVNHGESDKISMVSNQAKVYDHVVVAGRAAIERHERALINFDLDRLVVCGRPQLDLDITRALDPVPGLRTVLYAPTWSGEDEANNYTSVDRYGVEIVRTLLARDDVRLVYKPHPRVLTAEDEGVASAHAEIVRLVTAATTAERPHQLPLRADVLSLFDGTDLLVTDISSVGLDFLYLRPDAPIVLTDRRTDRERILVEAPVASATDIVDGDTVGDVADLLAANLASDPRRDARAAIRDHYFGFSRGESSRQFLELVSRCVARRDALVGGTDGTDGTDG